MVNFTRISLVELKEHMAFQRIPRYYPRPMILWDWTLIHHNLTQTINNPKSLLSLHSGVQS